MKKIISILIIVVIILAISTTTVFADPIDAMNGYGSSSGTSSLNNIGSKIFGLLQVVGSAVAFIMLVIIAIRFITSAPEEKAEVKKTLVGYAIGVIILLCCVTFLQIAKTIGDEISSVALKETNKIEYKIG